MDVFVWRGLNRYQIDEAFVLPTDYLEAGDGSIQPATNFPLFAQRFRQNSLQELLRLGVFAAAAYVVLEWIFPPYNSEPLSRSDRAFIRERDDEICYYCGAWAPDGHVDHMRSRKNNGSNDRRNLTWACILCNCTKGAMNADDFLAAYSFA